MLHESFFHGKQDIQKRLLIEAQIKAKQVIEYLQTALNDDKNLLSRDEKVEFEKIISQLQTAMSQSSAAVIQEHIQNISALMQPFLERRMTAVLREQLNKYV
jgi:molecular chaperone HscA